MTTLNITLEWFLNPDHIAMIAGIQTGAYCAVGLDVHIHEPQDHYDGFTGLFDGSTDIHTNEPLHLFEHYHPNLRALGTFFETDGGVLMRHSSLSKFHSGKTIKICTPVAEPATNRMGFEILKRYADTQGFHLNKQQIQFVSMGFHHLDNLKKHSDIDGAWLCFHNFEVVEAEHYGFDYFFIDQHRSPYANFSALEFISSRQVLEQKGDAIQKFLEVSSYMTEFCCQHPQQAKSIYYAYTQTAPDELTDKIIEQTLTRLICPIEADSKRWSDLYTMLREIGFSELSDTQYHTLWHRFSI